MEIKKPAAAFTRYIGKTTFNVNCYFNPEAKMSFEDKLLRIIRHEAMDKRGGCGIMGAPQIGKVAANDGRSCIERRPLLPWIPTTGTESGTIACWLGFLRELLSKSTVRSFCKGIDVSAGWVRFRPSTRFTHAPIDSYTRMRQFPKGGTT